MQEMQVPVRDQAETRAYPAPSSSSITLPDTSFLSDTGLSIACFDNEIPVFIEHALTRLYGSLFSSLAWFRVYGGLENVSTFVARRHGNVIAIFLFRRENRKVHVLNEGMLIDDDAVTQFARYVFKRFAHASVITFNAVENALRHLPYLHHEYSCHEDSIIALPATPDDYLDMLGKATRKNIKQYMNRIKRDFPSFEFQVYEGKDVEEECIRNVIRYNRLRFARKEKISGVTYEEEERIVRMIRECGIVGISLVEGNMVAGSLVYGIGDHYYSWIKAHDPAYDEYRLGLISSYLMISECISRGGKMFHLMWGREPHKALLKGEHHDRVHVTIFRSNTAALRHADLLFGHALKNSIRQGRLKLLAMQKNNGKLSEALRLTIGGLRKVKAVLAQRS